MIAIVPRRSLTGVLFWQARYLVGGSCITETTWASKRDTAIAWARAVWPRHPMLIYPAQAEEAFK